jgi:hypothetical protein
MHIRLDLNALTLDDLDTLEAARSNPDIGVWRTTRQILARFAHVSPNGEKMDYDDAYREVGKLTMEEVMGIISQMGDEMEALADQAIPPETAASS